MTEPEAQRFVTQFTHAWQTRRGASFLALWHPDGLLHSPFYDRPVLGRELGTLNDLLLAQSPHLTWSLRDWTFRGDLVVIEWENSNRYGERTVTTRGVDKFTLRDSKIAEEVVYTDTAIFRAARTGSALEPLVKLPPLEA